MQRVRGREPLRADRRPRRAAVGRAAVHGAAGRAPPSRSPTLSTCPSSARPARSASTCSTRSPSGRPQYANGRRRRSRDHARVRVVAAPPCPTTATGRSCSCRATPAPATSCTSGAELVAITDWELAHWGDLHDDLAWILVRDTLERFPDLEQRARATTSAAAASASIPSASATSACSRSSAPPSARSRGCAPTTRAARSRGSSSTTRCTRGCSASRSPRSTGVPVPPPHRPRTTPAVRRRGSSTSRSTTCATSCVPALDDAVRGDARQGHRPVAQVPPRGRRRSGRRARRRRAGPARRAARSPRSTTATRSAGVVRRHRAGHHRAPSAHSPTASTRPHATPRSCGRRWARSPTVTSHPSTSSQEAAHDRHDRR